MIKKLTVSPKAKKPDPMLLGLTLVLTFFGLLMVFNASVVEAFQIFDDKYYFSKLQLTWIGAGLAAMAAAAFLPLRLVKKLATPTILVTLVLLGLVLIPGVGSEFHGARRWLSFGEFNLQPTELAKLALIIYLSAWLTLARSFWRFLAILAAVLILIMLQPDLGTALIVIFTAVIVYYASGAPIFYLLAVGVLCSISGLGLIFSSAYRRERLLTYLNPGADPLGSSYHIRQALIAIGSGGLFGLGLGQSRQKYQFLPQATTDSIFAIVAEEVGFVGSAVLIVIFTLLILRILKIARFASDDFSRLLTTGIAGWIGLQVMVNIAAMLALVPLTGVPLPLISYGGSAMIATLSGLGLVLNVSRYQLSPKKK